MRGFVFLLVVGSAALLRANAAPTKAAVTRAPIKPRACSCGGDPHCAGFGGSAFDIQGNPGLWTMVEFPTLPTKEMVQISTSTVSGPTEWSDGLNIQQVSGSAVRIAEFLIVSFFPGRQTSPCHVNGKAIEFGTYNLSGTTFTCSASGLVYRGKYVDSVQRGGGISLELTPLSEGKEANKGVCGNRNMTFPCKDCRAARTITGALCPCREYNFEFGKAGSLLVNPPTHAPSALDGSYEVSLGKPATQSSTSGGGLPSFAVDGDSGCCSVARSARVK